MSQERMQEEEKRLNEEVARLLAEAEATDATDPASNIGDSMCIDIECLINDDIIFSNYVFIVSSASVIPGF